MRSSTELRAVSAITGTPTDGGELTAPRTRRCPAGRGRAARGRRRLVRAADAPPPPCRREDRVVGALEVAAQELADVALVLDDQHGGHGPILPNLAPLVPPSAAVRESPHDLHIEHTGAAHRRGDIVKVTERRTPGRRLERTKENIMRAHPHRLGILAAGVTALAIAVTPAIAAHRRAWGQRRRAPEHLHSPTGHARALGGGQRRTGTGMGDAAASRVRATAWAAAWPRQGAIANPRRARSPPPRRPSSPPWPRRRRSPTTCTWRWARSTRTLSSSAASPRPRAST